MENNNWAIDRLISIINEQDVVIKNMAKEICKLRRIENTESNINNIKREFMEEI